ncbi:MAG: MazG family protein, partial [Candidatus Rokuibacteriota bacterium]
MARLRGPEGCPWDRDQTPTSLKPCLIEEAYEVLEAIEAGDAGALREELGDLLLQVVFLAQIAAERGDFTMADLLHTLNDKLIRRHPHVFGDASVTTPGDALAQWEGVKQREAEARGRPRSVIDGVPRA